MSAPRRVIVCGSRTWPDRDAVNRRVAQLPPGGASSSRAPPPAQTGWPVTQRRSPVCTARKVPAMWLNGRRAGLDRNRAMLDLEPDLVIAFQCAGSRGTQDTIDEARRRGIPVEVHTA